jgi:hypothetical protein
VGVDINGIKFKVLLGDDSDDDVIYSRNVPLRVERNDLYHLLFAAARLLRSLWLLKRSEKA